MNINYKTQAMIRYLSYEVFRKSNTGVTQQTLRFPIYDI